MPAARFSAPVYVGIGVAGGFFSALFGVGGALVVVPLLILVAGFPPKPATGTALATVGLTALFGVVSFALLGAVEWGPAAMVGLPAVAGGLFGAWLQQRISSRLLVLLFAGFVVVIAVRLLVE